MAWNGYFRYGGTEIINAARTADYAHGLGLYWVKNSEDWASGVLPGLLGTAGYSHPMIDPAPWYDPDTPESANFAGIIPLEVTGIEDSTRESSVFEFIGDGGNPGTLRHATKTAVFNVALIGVDECAVEYGFRWLKRALMRRNCSPGTTVSCRGESLYYAGCLPEETGLEGLLWDGGTPSYTGFETADGGTPSTPAGLTADGGGPLLANTSVQWQTLYERHLKNVVFNKGPDINSKRTLKGCGGVVWLVSFTGVAGNPFEWGNLKSVLDGLGTGVNPYVAPYTGAWGSTTYTAASCPMPIFAPIYDPANPALVPPPAPPNIAPAGYLPPAGTWQRRYADIPPSLIPLWDEVRPVVTLRANTTDARMVRVRFYHSTSAVDANCAEVGEFLVSYIPADVDFIIDASLQAVYVGSGGVTAQRADSLVYGSWDAKPVNWFGLSCGDGYRVTLDWDTLTTPSLDMNLSLVPRSA